MKVLVVGAGSTGGYFGGRLLENNADVTFLVRENRRKQLQETGLVIKSGQGDFSSEIKTLVAGEEAPAFDLVILAVKSYHLENAVESIRPYITVNTALLPILNGVHHIAFLQEEFGKDKVLGGLTHISTTLGERGEIIHNSPNHNIMFGELDGSLTDRVKQIDAMFQGANCTFKLSTEILKNLWEKYIFITGLSGMTTLMDSSLGPIMDREEGRRIYQQFLNELANIAFAEKAPINQNEGEIVMNNTSKLGYGLKASMLRDVEKGSPIEVDHIQGKFLEMAKKHNIQAPVLEIIYSKLKVYEVKIAKNE